MRALREQLTELYGLADYNLGVGSGGGGGGGMDASPKALQGYSFRVDTLERGLLARQQEVRFFLGKKDACGVWGMIRLWWVV